MPRASYVFDRQRGKLVPKAEYYATRPRRQRSSLPAPMIIGDIQDVVSMADGRTYSSRKHWRDHLKAHGMVEMGNDMPMRAETPAITEQAIAEAYQQCEQGAGYKASDTPPEGWEGTIAETAEQD